jgi:hypothetical protein
MTKSKSQVKELRLSTQEVTTSGAAVWVDI